MSNTDLIVIKNLIKTYATGDTSFNALDDVSLSVNKASLLLSWVHLVRENPHL